jgi:hypothetical protein
MDLNDDTMTRGKMRSPSSIAEILRHPAKPPGVEPPPGPPKAEVGDPGGGPESFDPESTDYKAYGRPGNKTLPSLRIILKDGSEHGGHYADLATAYPGGSEFVPSAPGGTGNVIRLLFAGQGCPFLVVISGIRLRRVWELLMGHLTPWIYELPPGTAFAGDDEPVIRAITFEPVKI